MRPPLPAIEDPAPARFVFASLKGGVGRSTALSVAAAHLAARGGRVLAVDLDLEAHGLGSVLLTHKTLPEFGVVDVLVENGLQELGDSFYADLVGPCSLAVGGGRIDVMPAFGARSRRNPAEVLAKLSRAYTEDIATSGAVATIRDQVSSLIERYASPQQYDAIFVDARAGLNETSASAVTGLGAPSQPASTGMDRATDAGAGLRSRRFWRARSVQGSMGGDGSPFRADCRANRATFRTSP